MKKIIQLILILSVFLITITNIQHEVKIINAENIEEVDGEMRAVWMTPVTADLSAYTTESAFKTTMSNSLDMLEYYNMNTVIFHIRTHNNAYYQSAINPKAGNWLNVNFASFDPLEWLINETHKRGMEFHAWLNPYRLGSSSSYVGQMPSENPASNSDNILSYGGASILNPGLPNVRSFLVETVMEIVNNYNVDAIHFDDYFYINLGASGSTSGTNTILNEPDQQTFIKYKGSYNINSATDKANWRRDQVNLLIQSISNAIKNFNEANNRYVQFGISPTGIYKNGDGVVTYDANGKPITTGSKTGGQTHFSSYLFSDTVKWVTEGWLDYILPQSYWAVNHPSASFYEVMGWWNKVVKNIDINLYSGSGVYMADSTSNTYNWKSDMQEMKRQLEFLKTLDNVSGTSIFSFQHLRGAYNQSTASSAKQINNGAKVVWNKKTVLPVIKSFDPIHLPEVNNLKHNNGVLSFEANDEAKFYYIYRSSSELMFTNEEIVDVVYGDNNDVVSWETHDVTNKYNYGVRALSHSNHLGEKTIIADESDVDMVDGAAIRIGTESQALRFYAIIKDNVNYEEIGFYLSTGEITRKELENAIKNNSSDTFNIQDKVVTKVPIDKFDSDGRFSVIISDIKEEDYDKRYTVFAYYKMEDEIVVSNYSTSRSVADVVMLMMEANTNSSLDEIVSYLEKNYHIIE